MTETQTNTDPELGGTLEYDSNNSGGCWWLDDKDWLALKEAGWTIQWRQNPHTNEGERFLGALATTATKRFSDADSGIDEWSRITKQYPDAEGCNCCGHPHDFVWVDDKGNRSYRSVEITETRGVWS